MSNKGETFIGINMNQFHENQAEAKTTVDLRFVKANTAEEAKDFFKRHYPGVAWSVIRKATVDKGF